MYWNGIATEIILGVVGLVMSALGILITYLINKYIKNDELKGIVNSLNELVRNSVLEIYQTYVEALKKCGSFNETAQKEAQERCLALINRNMPENVHAWLQASFCDIDTYLKSLIEAQIGLLKNQSK